MTSTESKLLQEAERIGQQLLSRAKKDNNGVYWETITMDNNRQHVWEVSESIYGGCAGIALFFMELYKHTGNKLYYTTAEEALNRLVHVAANELPQSFAFFTGRIGVSGVLLKMYELSKNQKHLDAALEIARPCNTVLTENYQIDDLINGQSGILLALLHLHSYKPEKWIKDYIQQFAQHLVNRANTGKKGLYWDKTFQQIQGLCGFSHGAAGLGFVFIELGKYFNDSNCFDLARLAFQYESQYYMPQWSNWQDLRKSFYDPEDLVTAKKDYLAKNFRALTVGGDMSAWCHGAAGIALSRISAIEWLGEKAYAADLKHALEKVTRTDVKAATPQSSYTLCHGIGGNMDAFIEASLFFNDKKYLKTAKHMGLKAIEQQVDFGFYYSGFGTGGDKEDTSLFMGIAGVGYFMLRLLDPIKTPSVLRPVVKKHATEKVAPIFDSRQLKHDLLQKDFPKTLALLAHNDVKLLNTGLDQVQATNFNLDFIKWIKPIVKDQANTVFGKMLKEAFTLELAKRKLKNEIASYAQLFVEQSIDMEKLPEIELDLTKHSFQLAAGIQFKKVKYQHVTENANLNKVSTEPAMVMLKATHNGVVEDVLSDFSYWVLVAFKSPKRYKMVIEQLCADFGAEIEAEKRQVAEAVTEQVKNALRSHVLVATD